MRHASFGLFFIVLAVTLLLWGLVTAVLAQEEPPPPYAGLENPFPWADATAQEAGMEVFQQFCAACHVGAPAMGGDFTDTDFPQSLEASADLYFWIISEGIPDKLMPGYASSLSEEERWQVLSYVWSVAGEAPPTTAPPTQPLPTIPPPPYAELENPFAWDDVSAQEAGKVIFERPCTGCHVGTEASPSLGGDFSGADFPQRLEERPDFYFWAVSEGRLDKGMPAFKSLFSEEERWQVLTYIWATPPEIPPVLEPLDCVSCHFAPVPIPGIPRPEPLVGHDKLGTGSEACWACHRSTQMTTLHLAGGETQFPLEEFPRLCAQCHEKRYKAWQDGTHGIPTWQETGLEISAEDKVGCTACHNPHQPQIALVGITKDHPPAAPGPSEPPVELLQILGGSLLFLIVIGVIAKRGKEA